MTDRRFSDITPLRHLRDDAGPGTAGLRLPQARRPLHALVPGAQVRHPVPGRHRGAVLYFLYPAPKQWLWAAAGIVPFILGS